MAVAPRAGLGWRPVLGSEPGSYLPGQQWPKGSRSARLPNSRLECGVCAWRVFLLMVGCDPTNTTKHTRTALVMSRRNGPRASTVQLGQARLGSCVWCYNWHVEWAASYAAYMTMSRKLMSKVVETRRVTICELSLPPDVMLLRTPALGLVFYPSLPHTQRHYGRQRLRGSDGNGGDTHGT